MINVSTSLNVFDTEYAADRAIQRCTEVGFNALDLNIGIINHMLSRSHGLRKNLGFKAFMQQPRSMEYTLLKCMVLCTDPP